MEQQGAEQGSNSLENLVQPPPQHATLSETSAHSKGQPYENSVAVDLGKPYHESSTLDASFILDSSGKSSAPRPTSSALVDSKGESRHTVEPQSGSQIVKTHIGASSALQSSDKEAPEGSKPIHAVQSQITEHQFPASDDGSDTEDDMELVTLLRAKAKEAAAIKDFATQEKTLLKSAKKLAKVAARKPKYRKAQQEVASSIVICQQQLRKWQNAIDTSLAVLNGEKDVGLADLLIFQSSLAYCYFEINDLAAAFVACQKALKICRKLELKATLPYHELLALRISVLLGQGEAEEAESYLVVLPQKYHNLVKPAKTDLEDIKAPSPTSSIKSETMKSTSPLASTLTKNLTVPDIASVKISQANTGQTLTASEGKTQSHPESVLKELRGLGVTDDMIRNNRSFLKNNIQQTKLRLTKPEHIPIRRDQNLTFVSKSWRISQTVEMLPGIDGPELMAVLKEKGLHKLRQIPIEKLKPTLASKRSLLHITAGDVECLAALKYLLSIGLDPKATSGHEYTALYYAIEANNYGAVEMLLNHGANVNVVSNTGTTALMYCASRRLGAEGVKIARLLRDRGADPDRVLKDYWHGTAYSMSLSTGYTEAEREVFRGPRPPSRQDNTVKLPDEIDGSEMLEMLVEKGLNRLRHIPIEQLKSSVMVDRKYRPLLYSAAYLGEEGLVVMHYLLLIGLDPDANSRNTLRTRTPLMVAIESTDYRGLKQHNYLGAKMLLDYGADANSRTASGNTPLMLCALKCKGAQGIKMAKLLRDRGADPKILRKSGRVQMTAYDYAMRYGRYTAEEARVFRA